MKYYLNYFSLLLMFFFLVKNISAQDFHFSQFDLSPLYVSPALTGYMTAQNRIAMKYRSQWASVLDENQYETLLFSYDGRTCPNDGVAFAYGINLITDWVGSPVFQTNQYLGSIAAHVELRNDLYLSGGLQAGLLQYRFDASELNFANQFDGGVGFDSSLPSNEDFFANQDNINLLDLSGGVLLYSSKRAWNIGVAFHHSNPQKNYFAFTSSGVEDSNKTNVRWTVHGAIPFQAGKRGYVLFKQMNLIQLPHWQLNSGIDYRYQISKGQTRPKFNSLIIGVGLRLSNHSEKPFVTDAVMASFKTDIAEGLIFGLNYDFNISPLMEATKGVGGIEASLVWEFPINNSSNCIMCPDMNASSFGQGKWQLQ